MKQMNLSKVVIKNISKYMDIISLLNLLKTCKKYYKYRPIMCDLLDLRDEYKIMMKIMVDKLYVDEVINGGINMEIKHMKFYKRDYVDGNTYAFKYLTTHEAIIIRKFVEYCIGNTNKNYKDHNKIFSYIFAISKDNIVELLNIPKNPHEELRIRREGDRHVLYNLNGLTQNSWKPLVLVDMPSKITKNIWKYIDDCGPLILIIAYVGITYCVNRFF